MYPAQFAYHRPKNIDEALGLIAAHGDEAKLLAGGHSLLPAMKLRLAQPGHLIDLREIPALRGIKVEGNKLVVGAMTTHWEVESSALVKEKLPLLSQVAGLIADPQVRNRGTMGGSVVNADPAADYPATMLALEAEMACVGPGGERVVPATEWFQGMMTTAIGESEILREIRLPLLPAGAGWNYLKLPHPASRFALVGVSVVVELGNDGRCTAIRVGITGAGSSAARATSVEAALTGKTLDEATVNAASLKACDEIAPQATLQLTEQNKQQICCTVAARSILAAAARAGGRT
jgi:carbon-monoxide dehydrogenase medium subunit